MKKIVTTAAFLMAGLVTVSQTANAQKGLSLSIKGTPHLSMMLNSDDKDAPGFERKATFGASFGVGAGYNFTDNLGLGLDVLYSIQGQKYESAGMEFHQKVNYLKIPLMFTYNTNPSAPVVFTAKVGPQLGLRLSSKVTDNDNNDIIKDANDMYNSIDFGAVAGAGVRFSLTQKLSLDAGVRFDYSFTNAENSDYVHYTSGRATTNNLTAGIEVGLRYHL